MWRSTISILATLAAIILAFTFASCGTESEPPLEERAQSIDKSLICPVCPGETIDQAQVELARQMRAVVRQKLGDGWSRKQILQFFVDRYGNGVLAAPPKNGFNLIAWLVPPAAVASAAVFVLFVLRSMRKSAGTAGEGEHPVEQGLESYLSQVDRELGIADNPQESDKRG